MKNLVRILLFSLVIVSIFSNGVYAQNIEDAHRLSYLGLGFGARSLGLGTAYTSISNDFSAVYWNPAGLGRVRSNEFSMGLSHISYNNTSTLFGSKESFSNSGTSINSLGIVYPFPVRQGSLVFAIGYGRQSDFTSVLAFTGRYRDNTSIFPDNSFLQARIFESGGMNNWTAGGAIEAVKGLFIGASINFISGSYNYNRNYDEIDDHRIYPDTLDWNHKLTIDEDIGGFTARIGIQQEFRNRKGRIGLSIKLPTSLTLREDYVDDWVLETDRGVKYPDLLDGTSEFDLISPFVFSGGASYSFGDLMLAGDVEYTDWTQMEFSNTYSSLLDENSVIKEDMTATMNVRLGAELSLPENDLQVRAGFAYLPSPYRFDSAPNAQKFITGGLGWIVENSVRFDIGYAYGFWNTDHIVNFAEPSEEIQTHNLIATVSYRF